MISERLIGRERAADIALACALCPGECILECPVYTTTRLRSSAPNSLGRIVLRVLEDRSLPGEEKALWLCINCGACSKACPLGNNLGPAVWAARRKASGIGMDARAEPVEKILVDGKELLTVAGPIKPAEWVIEKVSESGLGLKWLDTSQCWQEALNGALPSEELVSNGVYSEDQLCSPVKKTGFTMLLENSLLPDYTLPAYILHVLEKPGIRESVYEEAREVLGEPARVVRSCTGAFLEAAGYESLALDMIKPVLDKLKDLPVVTPCARNALYMRKHDITAYTPLTLPLKRG